MIPFVESLNKEGATIKDIAFSEESRFLWGIQKYFRVLPTDPRFLSLTTEQLDLMYENMLIDQGRYDKNGNLKTDKKPIDKDFDEPSASKQGTTEYFDPEFEELWNEVEEEHNEIVNGCTIDKEEGDLPVSSQTEDFYKEEWEEV